MELSAAIIRVLKLKNQLDEAKKALVEAEERHDIQKYLADLVADTESTPVATPSSPTPPPLPALQIVEWKPSSQTPIYTRTRSRSRAPTRFHVPVGPTAITTASAPRRRPDRPLRRKIRVQTPDDSIGTDADADEHGDISEIKEKEKDRNTAYERFRDLTIYKSAKCEGCESSNSHCEWSKLPRGFRCDRCCDLHDYCYFDGVTSSLRKNIWKAANPKATNAKVTSIEERPENVTEMEAEMTTEDQSMDENLLEMQWCVLEVEESNLELEIEQWRRERNKL